jgi:DNA-binding IclR family transcriptional regulator
VRRHSVPTATDQRVASQLNGSLLRGFAILDLFDQERPELSTAEVAARLELGHVTAHRFLRTLEHAGALACVRKGVYRLGYRLTDLGERAARSPQLATVLRPILRALANDLGESTMATRFVNGEVECIATGGSGRALFVDMRVGARLEAYATANGKLWLSQLRPTDLEAYLDAVRLEPVGRNTLTDRDALLAELERVRERAYAVNASEREDGLSALAVPIVSRTGTMVAGMSVFGPEARLDTAFRRRALAQLRRAAHDALVALYGSPEPADGH